MSHLTDAPIDSQDLVKLVMRPSDGACVVFEGIVRNHHEGKSVESIFYDAYRPMAEKVGEASIVIACSSPHRGEAFEVCRAVIDRFKQTVPIWKKERGPGGEEWVGWQK